MMQQIFIDGKLADVGDNTEVTLTLNSNILTGAADFKGNNSLTINLPSTVRNRTLFGNADIVQGGGSVPYVFHALDYYRDGVQIVRDGLCRLMNATPDELQIAVVWGIRSAIDALLKADITVNNIETNAAITFNNTPAPSLYTDAQSDDVFYAAIDCVRHETDSERMSVLVSTGDRQWEATGALPASRLMHPSVRVNWILAQLESIFGMSFSWPVDIQAYIDTLIVPLITKTPNDITYGSGYTADVSASSTWDDENGMYLLLTTTNAASIIAAQSTPPDIMLVCVYGFSGVVKFNIQVRVDVEDAGYPVYHPTVGVKLKVNYGGDNVECAVLAEDAAIMAGELVGGYAVLDISASVPVSMEAGDRLYVRVDCITSDNPLMVDHSGEIVVNGGTLYISEIVGSENEVQPNQLYPVQGNLPDIKPIELIKFLCAVTGTFPVQSSTASVLTFKHVSDVFDWSHAEDWSRRLLSVTDRPVAAVKDYDVDGWAQQNWFKWKSDATVTGDYNGSINVDNETLDMSRDVITFPFAATDGNNIPMYSTEVKESGGNVTTEIKWNKVEPRVLRMEQDDSIFTRAFFDIDMSVIVPDVYGDLLASLAHPSVITETIRISDVELADINESKAIYLQQHGAYFALLSLTTKGNETAEVKLLKLTKEA